MNNAIVFVCFAQKCPMRLYVDLMGHVSPDMPYVIVNYFYQYNSHLLIK